MESQGASTERAEKVQQALREVFGMQAFRAGQLEAIMATLLGQDSLVILPTGGGKSVTFQLPCHTREYGFTCVICPLIALAKDQVDRCDERGIYAERWNCEIAESRKASIAKDIASDEPSVRLLYTTPESLRHPKLLESLKEACAKGTLVSFAVDEAHTVSQWGHDFRPAYLELSCIKQEFPSVPVAALTASCTPKVMDDIISVLRLRAPKVVKGSFNRPNIAYEVRHKELIGDGTDNAALEDLIRFIEERPHQCGIIYARLRATCDWLASSLAARDVDVGCYHAGKGTDARARVQRDWSEGGLNVVVATIAFGMGIDRADVRWVVHWNAPSSMEGFYQESGRAGRDGQPSVSVVYASRSDLEANHKMERGTRSGAVAEVASYAHGAGCRRRHVIKFFGEDRGPCDRMRDQLCDYCTDPGAVQRALSRLVHREAEQGSKAAAVRARMMGIRVASEGGGSGEEGTSDNEEGGASVSVRVRAVDVAWLHELQPLSPASLAAAGDKASKLRTSGGGAMWSRASAYGSASGATVACSQHFGASAPAYGSATAACADPQLEVKPDAMQPPVRRLPALKRPLATAAVAMPAHVVASCAPAVTGAGTGTQEQTGPAIAVDGSTGSAAAAARQTDADGPCVGEDDGIALASHSGQPEPSVLRVRQPQLKRPKPGMLLPFKVPVRDGGVSQAVAASSSAGLHASNGPDTAGAVGCERGLQLGSSPVAGRSSSPAACEEAALPCAGVSVTGVLVGDKAGTAPVIRAPLLTKRRLPFKPPLRVAPA